MTHRKMILLYVFIAMLPLNLLAQQGKDWCCKKTRRSAKSTIDSGLLQQRLCTFTVGQGTRCCDYILTESFLTDATAGDNFTIFLSFTYNDDYKMYLARNVVTFDANTFVSTGTNKLTASANAIVVKPATQIKPTSNSGYPVLQPNLSSQ